MKTAYAPSPIEWLLASLVPSAIMQKADLINPDRQVLSNIPPGQISCILFSFCFSGMHWRIAQETLILGAKCGRTVYVADFTIAERNMEIPLHVLTRMFFAGRKKFWLKGGLENFCLRAGMRPHGRIKIMGGAATIVNLKGAQCARR